MRAEVIADRHSKGGKRDTLDRHWIGRARPTSDREIGACRALVSAARSNHTKNIHGRYLVCLSRSPSCFLFRSANERSPSSNLAIVGTLNARNRASYVAETYVSAGLRANCRPSIAVFVRHGTNPREFLLFLLLLLLECLVLRLCSHSKRTFIRFPEILAMLQRLRRPERSGLRRLWGMPRLGSTIRASNLAGSLISCEVPNFQRFHLTFHLLSFPMFRHSVACDCACILCCSTSSRFLLFCDDRNKELVVQLLQGFFFFATTEIRS